MYFVYKQSYKLKSITLRVEVWHWRVGVLGRYVRIGQKSGHNEVGQAFYITVAMDSNYFSKHSLKHDYFVS